MNYLKEIGYVPSKQMKDAYPLLWKSVQEDMINSRIILQSKNKLYVYNL